ncbi:hypothetical protein [Streptomyces sp. NPDC007355]|uniref:hypothetical protein n=1 Tax=Streptomyces sp. NPDC007355 TaxID=3364778 RepID=UPI0036C05EC6
MFSSPVRVIGMAAAAAALAVGFSSSAQAVPDTMDAPYAQAAARIHADGTIRASKGIDTVTHPRTGVYCVSFTKNLNLPQTAPQATVESDDFGVITVITTPYGWCNNEQGTLSLLIRGQDGARKDLPFTLAIP